VLQYSSGSTPINSARVSGRGQGKTSCRYRHTGKSWYYFGDGRGKESDLEIISLWNQNVTREMTKSLQFDTKRGLIIIIRGHKRYKERP
jgi:hypothetical protein